MENGHANPAPETDGLDDLAGFLMGTPETEPEDDEDGATADPGPDEDTQDEANDQEGDPEVDGDEPDAEADDKTEPPTDPISKVPLKNDDGTVTEIEVTQSELIKGYHRQSHFTKEMQALSERESNAFDFLKTKHEEVRNQYAEKAEFYHKAVSEMAGLRTESEMSQLAQSDPAAWVSENQRQQSIRNFLGQLDNSIRGERSQAQEQAERSKAQSIQQMTARAWSELTKEKIDKPALAKIYEGVNKTYGFSNEELGNVYDHRLVKMMRDATAYQALKAKAPEVTRKAATAPRMPAARQATPAQERKNKVLSDRFKGGRGSLNDLAAFLA